MQELVSGISLGGSSGGGGVAALVQYYLFGTGGTVFSVLNSAVGLDVPGQLVQANATLLELQASCSCVPLWLLLLLLLLLMLRMMLDQRMAMKEHTV